MIILLKFMLGPFFQNLPVGQMSWGPHFSAWLHPRQLGCPLLRLGAIADGERCGECGQPKNEPTPKIIQNHPKSRFLMGFQPSPFLWVVHFIYFIGLPTLLHFIYPWERLLWWLWFLLFNRFLVQGHVKSINIMVSNNCYTITGFCLRWLFIFPIGNPPFGGIYSELVANPRLVAGEVN